MSRDNVPRFVSASDASGLAASDEHPAAPGRGRGGLSLRLRLMLMLLAVFGVIQVALSIFHLLNIRQTAYTLFERDMTAATNLIVRRVQNTTSPLSDTILADIATDEAAKVLGQACAITVYESDGTLVASGIRPPIPPTVIKGFPGLSDSQGSLVSQGVALDSFPSGEKNTRSTVAARPYDYAGRRRVLIIAAPETFVAELTDRATTDIVVLTPVGLLAAAFAGWVIAGIAVRPLRQLGLIASQMRPDNLAQPIDFQSSAHELTSLKQELDQMRQRIETGYEAQERFVANVSHELKTPIATVLTEAQTLGRPDSSPREVRQFIESTQDEMRRLGRLVESFLMLTRVRHGKPLESTRTTIPVNDFVLDSLQHCWKFAEQHGVRLHAVLAEETDRDLLMIGDPELLRTLVDNLLRNAIRFSPQGSRVEVVVRTDGADKICICVQDKGPGIPEPLIDRIFDRFAQGKGEEKLGRGSGLGLEIAQGIAELHGGRISVGNIRDGGCEFCATLPLAHAPDNPAASTAHAQVGHEADSPAV